MKLIILTGPTASGKTRLSLELAKRLKTEIISADSMQIYQYMDIGTDKISEEEQNGINHHLLSYVKPWEEYTVDDYKKDANRIIKKLNKKNQIPLIVGGTGLYIDSLIYDLDFTIAPPNPDIRNYYEKLADKKGNKFLHNILKKVDPESARKNHPNQRKRIIRALEVYDHTGKAFSSFGKGRKYLDNVDFVYLVLNRDRKKLYERINNRVAEMFDSGLVEEVKTLIEMGCTREMTSMQAIGYKEIFDYFDGQDLSKTIEEVKKNSRHYAKRQLSWFRREKSSVEIFIDENSQMDDIIDRCLEEIRRIN